MRRVSEGVPHLDFKMPLPLSQGEGWGGGIFDLDFPNNSDAPTLTLPRIAGEGTDPERPERNHFILRS